MKMKMTQLYGFNAEKRRILSDNDYRAVQTSLPPGNNNRDADGMHSGMLAFAGKIGNQDMNRLLESEAANTSGTSALPSRLRRNMESKSGLSLENVRVRYNSPLPQEHGADAMTFGQVINIAPGSGDALAHEAWHTVQQMRGEVQGASMSGGLHANESPALEREADAMGHAAMYGSDSSEYAVPAPPAAVSAPPVAQFKKRKRRKASGGKGGGFFHKSVIGNAKDRNTKFTDRIFSEKPYTGKDIQVSEGTGTEPGIKGKKYTPKGDSNGKNMILYSGSGGGNLNQMQKMVLEYTTMGYTVYCCDYRGFSSETGKTDHRKTSKGFNPTEATIYEDSRKIFDFVKKDSGKDGKDGDNSDIVLHGFSLGGAAASRVAADIAEENSKKVYNNDDEKEKDRLGGLVLHSSIDNTYNAAKNELKSQGGFFKAFSSVGAWLAKKKAGDFSTKNHLKDIGKYDPDLPVHFMSGKKEQGDQLSLGTTELDKKAGGKYGLTAVTSSEGTGAHINDSFGYAPESHVSKESRGFLSRLFKRRKEKQP